MPGDPLGQGEGVLETGVTPVRDAARALDHGFHVRALVDAPLIIAGANAVDLSPISRSLELARHQADDRRAVEPARQAGAHRNIGAEVDAHGIGQQRTKAISSLALADVERARLEDPVPAADRQIFTETPALQVEAHTFPAAKLAHAFEQRPVGMLHDAR